MQSRLLIINCPSEYFFHIPMGTFGLCDYLNKRGIPVKLLNLALYNRQGMDDILSQYMNLFQPTHVGIVFHWQETAEGVKNVAEYIRLNFKSVCIACGGFTAGYFGESLLNEWGVIDYVIKGDPESPLELLLAGMSPSKIPNLVYRGKTGICSNKVSYYIDQNTLSGISFGEMTCLYDYDLYVNAIEEKLGFPVFLGRGCAYNCRYCGGSSQSFRLHSGRKEPVARSVESVIKDLKRIKDFTRKIYICYENDRFYIKELFRAIEREETLVKTFLLNYGAWQLFDNEFLELYRDAFVLGSNEKPVFELSPEVFDNKGRKKVKCNTVPYSIKDLIDNQKLVSEYVGDNVNTSIFFSRYHEVLKTYRDIREEIIGIFRLQHMLLCNNMQNVHVYYDHLSTDVASRYWTTHMETPRDFNTFMLSIKRLNTQKYYKFPVNNLCMYIPETLSENEIIRCELLITILKAFEMYFHEMFHIFLHCIADDFIGIVENIISERYVRRPEQIFKTINYSEVLKDVKQGIIKQDSLISKVPFIDDITELFLKKSSYMGRQKSERTVSKRDAITLNNDLVSIHEHDYLDLLNFLKRLEKEDPSNLIKEKTVFIFFVDDIMSMPYATYCETLKAFEAGISLEDYYDLMKRKGIFTPSYHENLMERLLQSNVLF